MANNKQKQKKKKQREQIARKRVLKRRAEIQARRKLAHQEEMMRLAAEMVAYGKPKPIVADPEVAAKMEAERTKSIKEQLEKNLEILKALEEEYDREQSQREELNETLEGEGYMTIKEKMGALHKKAVEMQGLVEGYVEDADAALKEK